MEMMNKLPWTPPTVCFPARFVLKSGHTQSIQAISLFNGQKLETLCTPKFNLFSRTAPDERAADNQGEADAPATFERAALLRTTRLGSM